MTSKPRIIGHDMLRVILDHERTIWNDLTRREYQGNQTYMTLLESNPDLFAIGKERLAQAHDLTTWAIANAKHAYPVGETTPSLVDQATQALIAALDVYIADDEGSDATWDALRTARRALVEVTMVEGGQ